MTEGRDVIAAMTDAAIEKWLASLRERVSRMADTIAALEAEKQRRRRGAAPPGGEPR